MALFTFTGIILREEPGYSSLCPELDVASMGTTPNEARVMLLEAATLHLEGAIEDGLPFLRPVPPSEDPRRTVPQAIEALFNFNINVEVHAYA